ncbi:MAG: transcriptional activator RfaH [Proteobacteria bacterium]|nr:transcriptional activator RfaH [Pseudomonadota bacterium]
MKQWFVVHTQPSKELVAQRHLLEQKYDVYLPRFKKICRHARKTREVLSPLFPRYLFIGIDLEIHSWRSINGTRGVSYLLTQDNCPLSLPSQIIEDLKQQENSDGILPLNCLVHFTKGDKLVILNGPFEGHTAIFEKLDDKQRVKVFLNFLGREMNVILSQDIIEAA